MNGIAVTKTPFIPNTKRASSTFKTSGFVFTPFQKRKDKLMINNENLIPIKKAVEEFSNPTPFYRFEVFHGEKDSNGKVFKSKSVGMAYLRPGDQKFGLRLFTFVDDRFYLLPDQHDPSIYLILTSIRNHSPNAQRKYVWNVIGRGSVNTKQGLIELHFDLFERPIYVNIFPERSATGTKIPEPIFLDEAA